MNSPDAHHDPEDAWADEWNDDDWYELHMVDRNERNEASWSDWLLKLAAVAIALPLVLGLLAYALILIF